MQKLMQFFTEDSVRIFKLDFSGAILSAILLGLVLPGINYYIGMSDNRLYFLAVIALALSVYSKGILYSGKHKNYLFLRVLAFVNIFYALLTLVILILDSNTLLVFGWIYFILESTLVLLLAWFELYLSQTKYLEQ